MSRNTKTFLVIAIGIILFFLLIIHGEPIHDINFWRIQAKFYLTDIPHPQSVLLKRISYLGGPSLHGDNLCIYAVGEMRVSPLTKTEIANKYKTTNVYIGRKTLPLRVIFTDEYKGPYTSPYTDWQAELRKMPESKETVYIVYISTERPVIFYDGRCDD